MEPGRSEGSFLAGDQFGDRARDGVEVLASAEVTRRGPPVQVADAVLDTDALCGMGLAFGLVSSGDGGQDEQLAGPTRKPGLARVSPRCVLTVGLTWHSPLRSWPRTERLRQAASPGLVVFDELGLNGFVRAVPGVVPARLAVARAGHRTVVVPGGDAGEADDLADVLPGPLTVTQRRQGINGSGLTAGC